MGEETRAAARAVETLERKDRILIVEDEDNARKGYEQLLQRWGYDVLGVGSAEEVLAKFAGYQPDTLIADVELPGMNGLDLLKQLGPDLHGEIGRASCRERVGRSEGTDSSEEKTTGEARRYRMGA